MLRAQTGEFLCFLILGMLIPIALSSFPGLPICLRRQSDWTSLVRLSESIVSGGSLTIYILIQSRRRTTGFLPKFSDELVIHSFEYKAFRIYIVNILFSHQKAIALINLSIKPSQPCQSVVPVADSLIKLHEDDDDQNQAIT